MADSSNYIQCDNRGIMEYTKIGQFKKSWYTLDCWISWNAFGISLDVEIRTAVKQYLNEVLTTWVEEMKFTVS